MAYETTFENGDAITDYLAIGIIEGFEETDNPKDKIKAWSYIIGKKLYLYLQGWFGRMGKKLIADNFIQSDGTVNWDNFDDDIEL